MLDPQDVRTGGAVEFFDVPDCHGAGIYAVEDCLHVCYLSFVGKYFYTSINIPYGSMASAITTEASERTALSTSRSIGATLAGLVIGIVTPLFLYTTDADGNQVVRGGGTFTVVAGIFSILALICYLVCYRMTTERVAVEREVDTESVSLRQRLVRL